MKVGDVITMTAGKWSCKYLITNFNPNGYILRRAMTAKTKADNNRFQETIIIKIEGNMMLDKTY
jgi:hypothetical protein